MKTNKLKKLKIEMSLRTTAKIIFFSILVLFIFLFLFDDILNDYIATKIAYFDGILWYRIMKYKTPIVLGVYSFIVAIVSYYVIKRENKYVDKLFSSINSIIVNPEVGIKLDNDLELLEVELNKIRMSVLESNAKAKDEENKKNDLIMYMAHDLKTPLTSVIGYLTLLKEEKKISGNMRDKYTDIALDKALRVEELTNQFFEITRYNLSEMQLSKKEIDLTLLIDQLVDECYPMLQEKNLKLKFTKSNKIIYNCDGNLLARAFGNLIKNAISYSTPKTTIEVNIEEKNKKIEITFKNKGDKIPDYKLKRLFEKFYRADSARTSATGGTGIGLSIAKDIINLHEGKIDVKNDDEYIVFTIILSN